jgi:hypothetical protein
VFVTIACAGFGWLGYKMRQAQRQQEAVRAIVKCGGDVVYDYRSYHAYRRSHIFDATPPGPIWVRIPLGIDFVANVSEVNSLKTNRRWGLIFRDADLMHVQELSQLVYIDLDRQQITDAGLMYLQGLTRLRHLDLSYTQITDSGLAHLRRLPVLKVLFLSDTHISDAGIVHLQAIDKLTHVAVTHTEISENGCQQLQRARPNLIIYR